MILSTDVIVVAAYSRHNTWGIRGAKRRVVLACQSFFKGILLYWNIEQFLNDYIW